MLVELLNSRQPEKEEHVGGCDSRHDQIGMRRSMSASQQEVYSPASNLFLRRGSMQKISSLLRASMKRR